jgi:mono/diheme cytochrome c family protein
MTHAGRRVKNAPQLLTSGNRNDKIPLDFIGGSGKMQVVRTLTLALSAILALETFAQAQHSYTPADIAAGGQLYRTHCLGCHGPAGDAIANAPVMNGKFRRGSSDEELIRLVRSGISGTAMAAQPSLSEAQAGTIVGFLRSVATATPSTTNAASNMIALPAGDSARGKTLFEGKGNCLSCHRVSGNGSQFAPDLSAIGNPPIGRGGGGRGGAPAAAAAAIPPVPAGPNITLLQESLLDPNAVMTNANRYVQLAMRDGSIVTGKLLNQDTYAVQILNFREQLQSVPREKVKEVAFKSPMPSYRDKLTTQELADLISYLGTLKGNQ